MSNGARPQHRTKKVKCTPGDGGLGNIGIALIRLLCFCFAPDALGLVARLGQSHTPGPKKVC